jgi:hypothetical protein
MQCFGWEQYSRGLLVVRMKCLTSELDSLSMSRDYVSGSDARAFRYTVATRRNENLTMPAVTFIDAIPNHISEEDHRTLTGATPASFADIPPVLRHKVNDVAVAFDPPLDGFSGEDSARGTLYIIERYTPLYTHQTRTADHTHDGLQCARVPVVHDGTRISDRVSVHNAACDIARRIRPLCLLPARRFSSGSRWRRGRRRGRAAYARAQFDTTALRFPCVPKSHFLFTRLTWT